MSRPQVCSGIRLSSRSKRMKSIDDTSQPPAATHAARRRPTSRNSEFFRGSVGTPYSQVSPISCVTVGSRCRSFSATAKKASKLEAKTFAPGFWARSVASVELKIYFIIIIILKCFWMLNKFSTGSCKQADSRGRNSNMELAYSCSGTHLGRRPRVVAVPRAVLPAGGRAGGRAGAVSRAGRTAGCIGHDKHQYVIPYMSGVSKGIGQCTAARTGGEDGARSSCCSCSVIPVLSALTSAAPEDGRT